MLVESSWDWTVETPLSKYKNQSSELKLHPGWGSDPLHPGLWAGEARPLHRKNSFLRVGGVGQVPPELLPGGATPNLRTTEPRGNFPPFLVFLQLVVEEKVSVECWVSLTLPLNTYSFNREQASTSRALRHAAGSGKNLMTLFCFHCTYFLWLLSYLWHEILKASISGGI